MPAAVPMAGRGGQAAPAGETARDSQGADFAAFLAFLSDPGAGQMPATPNAAAAALGLTEAALASANGPSSGPPALPGLFAPGGRFSPLTGSPLPVALPDGAAASDASLIEARQQAALAALGALQDEPLSGTTRSAASDPLAQLLTTGAGLSPAPAAWLRTLLPGDRGATNSEIGTDALGDAISAGNALTAPNGASRNGLPTTAIVLPSNPGQQPAFEQALGERLVFLVQEGRQDARLRLNPAELGSIDIRLSLDGDATRISLASPHAAVRDALEQAVPRLRELLGHAGFDLSQVDVGAGDARSPGNFGRPSTGPAAVLPDWSAASGDIDSAAVSVSLHMPRGLVDTFA